MKAFYDYVFSALLYCTCICTVIKAQNTKFVVDSALIQCEDSQGSQNFAGERDANKMLDFTLENSQVLLNNSIFIENNIVMENTKSQNCKRKITLALKILTPPITKLKNSPNTDGDVGALLQIETAVDANNNQTVQLGQPIAVRIQQLPVFQLYSIKYLYTINAKVREEVFNYENTQNFEGCNESDNPICEPQIDDSDSQTEIRGFCCPCSPGNFDSASRQIRGEQLCHANSQNSATNETESSKSVESSVHCLKSSKFWYGVYEIRPPEIFQQVFIQVYKRLEDENGTISWHQFGESNEVLRVGTHNDYDEYKSTNLSVVYHRLNSTSDIVDLLYQPSIRLLIPKLWPNVATNPPQNGTSNIPLAMMGPVGETYLVVQNSMVDPTGRQCNKAGVKNLAFLTQQSDPCKKPKGTCLGNQPLDLWALDDKKLFKAKRDSPKQQFKLKHFGFLYTPFPLKRINDELYLVFESASETKAHVDISLPIDEQFIMRPGQGAALLNIISDSSGSVGKLTIQIANTEFVPSYFAAQVLECTEPALTTPKTELKIVLAQDITTFLITLSLTGKKYLNSRATCSVAVVNSQSNKIIAIREALLSPGDTCFCKLHCRCVCSKDEAPICKPMWNGKIIAAGLDLHWFPAIENEIEELSALRSIGLKSGGNRAAFYILATTLLISLLLLLGLIKALIGKCCQPVALFGLGHFYNKPRRLSKYYEKIYSQTSVIHDAYGFPLDPFTKEPTVQRMSGSQIFVLNLVFFLILPWLLLSCLCHYSFTSPFNSPKSSRTSQKSNERDHSMTDMKVHSAKKSDFTERYPQSEPLIKRSTNTLKSAGTITRSRINSLRQSDSSVEYNYRRSQGGGTEYSVNGGEWRSNPSALSQSNTSQSHYLSRNYTTHIPLSELDLP